MYFQYLTIYSIINIYMFLVPLFVYVESRSYVHPVGGIAIIKVNGIDYAKNTRGFNIVVVDLKTGKIEVQNRC